MARILRKAKAHRGSGQRVTCLALLRVPWEDQQARQNHNERTSPGRRQSKRTVRRTSFGHASRISQAP